MVTPTRIIYNTVNARLSKVADTHCESVNENYWNMGGKQWTHKMILWEMWLHWYISGFGGTNTLNILLKVSFISWGKVGILDYGI